MAVKALPETHGKGLVSRPGRLTRVHLRLSGQLAQRLHGADAQLLGRQQISGQSGRPRGGLDEGGDGSQGLKLDARSYGANVSEIFRNCFDHRNCPLPSTPAEIVMAGLPSLPPTGPLAYELC